MPVTPAIAIAAALLAALSWAVASITIGRLLSRGGISAPAANLFKNGVAATAFFIAALIYGGNWPVGQAWGWLALSGLLGFAVSDALYFGAFPRCGVQTAASILLLNVPIATLLAVPLAGDALDFEVLPYMGLVLFGVLLAILDPKRVQRADGEGRAPARSYFFGVLLALGAAFAIGTAVPLGRGRFDDVGVCPGGFVRLVGGAFGAFPLALLVGLRGRSRSSTELANLVQPMFTAPGPGSVWGGLCLFGVGCAVVGLAPYHYALRELPGGLSALLFASTPLFTLPIALVLGERVGWLSVIGTVVGFVGVGLILLRGDALGLPENPAPVVRPLELESVPGTRVPTFVAGEYRGAARRGVEPTRPIVAVESEGKPPRVVRLDPRGVAPIEATSRARDVALYVNWADVPRAVKLGSGATVVAYLERLGDETSDYGVRLTLDEDGPPGRDLGWLHGGVSPVEHGFASIAPEADGGATFAWLEGRGGGEGMRLYACTLRADGVLRDEVLLDDRVCDCCPTSSVVLDDGAVLVAYRDRTDDDVRDVACVRRESDGQTWAAPVVVHTDGWEISGCPVNGPAIAANKDDIAVAWFTRGTRGGFGEVRVAFSRDGGRTFDEPTTLVRRGTLGQVALAPFRGGDARARGSKFAVVHLASRAGETGADVPATWEALVVGPGSRQSERVPLATVEATRRSGRLDLISVGGGAVEAVWSQGAGLAAARLSLPEAFLASE